MKLVTIWTLPAATLREKIYRTGDWAAFTAAARLPGRVRYWAVLQGIGQATKDSPHVPGETVDSILPKLRGGPQ